MTDRTPGLLDSNRLAYTGGAPSAADQARIARRWGWWLYAEYRLTSMRAYLPTILIRSIGLPLLYLSSMGLGLGALVDSGAGRVEGVSYLVFVGPGAAGVVHRDGGHRRVHLPGDERLQVAEALLRRHREPGDPGPGGPR